MGNKVKYWTDLADYDLETAEAMLKTGRLLYVGFMCHQVIEKMLKAYWSKYTEEPPLKIHTLSRLADKSGINNDLTEEQFDLIDFLEPLNIEARYPTYKERLLKSLTNEICNDLIKRTRDFKIWIHDKL